MIPYFEGHPPFLQESHKASEPHPANNRACHNAQRAPLKSTAQAKHTKLQKCCGSGASNIMHLLLPKCWMKQIIFFTSTLCENRA